MRSKTNEKITESYTPQPKFENIPILANPTTANGYINWNHYSLIEFNARFAHDALVMMRTCPVCYLKSVAEAIHVYLRPGSDYPYFGANHRQVGPVQNVFDTVIYGNALPRLLLRGNPLANKTFPVLLVSIPLAMLGGIYYSLALLRRHDLRAPIVLAMTLICAFVSVVNILAEVDENQKYRFEIDPLLMILGVFTAWHIYSYWKTRRQNRKITDPEMASSG
jgi:hypothetical protein